MKAVVGKDFLCPSREDTPRSRQVCQPLVPLRAESQLQDQLSC